MHLNSSEILKRLLFEELQSARRIGRPGVRYLVSVEADVHIWRAAAEIEATGDGCWRRPRFGKVSSRCVYICMVVLLSKKCLQNCRFTVNNNCINKKY